MPHVSWNSRAQHIAIRIAIRVCRIAIYCNTLFAVLWHPYQRQTRESKFRISEKTASFK